ncbi:MAG: sel1 repeat family protein, partial [Desulfobacterales bacterium]|nr:sel1 repeat family protein [Desulfobacterales bacterium]
MIFILTLLLFHTLFLEQAQCQKSLDQLPDNLDVSKINKLKEMADGGEPFAMVFLGQCHRAGKGVEKNHKKAMDLFQKAAAAGNTTAMFILGEMHQKGEGSVEPDYSSAMKWYEQAFKNGDLYAMVPLGSMHEQGLGSPRDIGKAVECYRLAAEMSGAMVMGLAESAFHDGEIDKALLFLR